MKRFLTFLPLYFILTFTVFAWGPNGHRIISEISQCLLDEEVNGKVTAVLDNSTIAMVSNWADFMRYEPAYENSGAETWHYTNLEPGLNRMAFDTMALKRDNGECVYRIVELTAYLKQKPDDKDALMMLIHFMEDMHCPMHLGGCDDRGGNSIPIKWHGRTTNLHSLWDDAIVDFYKLSYTEYATHLMRTKDIQKKTFSGETSKILDWAWETYKTTKVVYDSANETSNSYAYSYKYQTLLESRLILAAEHLAAVLNYIYK